MLKIENVYESIQNSSEIKCIIVRSYDVLICMDWLEKHKVVLNCFEKTFTCLDD